MNAGDVFYFPGIAERHKWTIISDPAIDPSKVLFVNFTSHDRYVDCTCVLNAGDHPFIEHKTVIEYGRGKIGTDSDLNRLRDKGHMKMLQPLRPEILKRIRDAAMESPEIKGEAKQILIDQGLAEELW